MIVALVTGASRGIGKASAIALAGAGFDVAVAARTLHAGESEDPGSLDETTRDLGRSLTIRMDLHDRASLTDGVARVLDEWGRIDVLVNNAVDTGPGSMDRIEDTTIEIVETKLAANAVAPLVLIKAVLPAMLERGSGTIINVTSHVALNDPPAPAGEGGWGLAYAMSKGALHRIAGHLAIEYGARGIRAFNVDPGFVLTERMTQNQGDLGLNSYRGAPPSVPASVFAWLASSPDAAELNGQTVLAQKFALTHDLHPDWRKR